MNEHDRKELIKRLDGDPKFRALFNQLVALGFKMQQDLPTLTAQMPNAQGLREGKRLISCSARLRMVSSGGCLHPMMC